MLAWGRAAEGQLGLGGIEEVLVSTPTLNKRLNSHRLVYTVVIGIDICVFTFKVALGLAGSLWS